MHSSARVEVLPGDCLQYLRSLEPGAKGFDLTFLDPPFNQGKDYRAHDDRMSNSEYWNWMREICGLAFDHATAGSALYFMQREKNAEHVLRVMRETGWHFQNLVVWQKKTSAIPALRRFGKAFQVIGFATKGPRPRVFNRLRIDPPIPDGYYPRDNGRFVTDIWDDIRELTSGYFAGDEPLRDQDGERIHKQQSPIALLLRIILSSTLPDDCVFDPFAGTGTTLCVADQLGRCAIGVEKDPLNVLEIEKRLAHQRAVDAVTRFRSDYSFTPNLGKIWPSPEEIDDLGLDASDISQYALMDRPG
jgi:DNA modification methylase